MTDEVKTNAEALVPRFKLDRVLNQGASPLPTYPPTSTTSIEKRRMNG
jgi:hypothetical protein